MKLTGKCLEVFEAKSKEKGYIALLPESCQNALIIEFFDSVGIYIGILICIDETFDSYILYKDVKTECSQFQENRIKATNAAIEKANEIFNQE